MSRISVRDSGRNYGQTRISLIVLLLLGTVWPQGCQDGKVFEVREKANSKFTIRITAREEGGWVGGANYIFESAKTGSNDWHEFMRFRHDDPKPIPINQIKFVNDDVGYVFMGWMYAVSTDRGENWSVWTAERDLPNWKCCNYGLIRDVEVTPGGTGKMTLNWFPERSGEVPELRTENYGRDWNR